MFVSHAAHVDTTKATSLRAYLRALAGRSPKNLPALKSVHELSRCVQALAHQCRLLSNGYESIFKQTGLVLGGGRCRHLW